MRLNAGYLYLTITVAFKPLSMYTEVNSEPINLLRYNFERQFSYNLNRNITSEICVRKCFFKTARLLLTDNGEKPYPCNMFSKGIPENGNLRYYLLIDHG
ncbi:hypothetical protein NPIL_534991, partial [Nephila pilipes]